MPSFALRDPWVLPKVHARADELRGRQNSRAFEKSQLHRGKMDTTTRV
jgi:hypothetical protein